MIFRSETVDAQWDTWCYYHDGQYYLYYLITENSPGEGFGVATSTDGVHWEDHGWALRRSDKAWDHEGSGAVWKSPDYDKTGGFLCNYQENRKEEDGSITQNIFFAWSTDLIHWTKFGHDLVFKADERYYQWSDCPKTQRCATSWGSGLSLTKPPRPASSAPSRCPWPW